MPVPAQSRNGFIAALSSVHAYLRFTFLRETLADGLLSGFLAGLS